MVVEEEDKPKPEGETSDDELAKLREELKKELKQKRKELSGKSLDDLFAEVSSKSFDELVVKIKEEAAKIIRLVVGDNDWQEVQPEIAEKAIYLSQLQEELVSRPKKLGGYKKWAEAFTIERRAFSLVEKRDIQENRELFNERLKDLNAALESNKWSAGEILQISILIKLDKMIFDNSKSSAEGRLRSIENSISDIQFQAEIAETMLGVREEQAKTAKILDGILEEQTKMREQMFSWKNFLFLAGAALVGAFVLSDKTLQELLEKALLEKTLLFLGLVLLVFIAMNIKEINIKKIYSIFKKR